MTLEEDVVNDLILEGLVPYRRVKCREPLPPSIWSATSFSRALSMLRRIRARLLLALQSGNHLLQSPDLFRISC